jgi:DNA-binding SARP family transcriptional activator
VGGVRFALLGTLVLTDGAGEPMPIPGARQRALLASLLLSANKPVSVDALCEAVWDGAPPPGASTTLRSYVRRLRQALGPATDARITTCDPGYRISVQEPELDVLGFEAACADAGAARRGARWQDASAAASRALQLWRGTPLLDVSSQVLRDQFVPRLEQLWLQALEDRTEADLRLGRQDRLIPELRDLTARHPMRERFHAQLMEALAREGRQAESAGGLPPRPPSSGRRARCPRLRAVGSLAEHVHRDRQRSGQHHGGAPALDAGMTIRNVPLPAARRSGCR